MGKFLNEIFVKTNSYDLWWGIYGLALIMALIIRRVMNFLSFHISMGLLKWNSLMT